MTAESSHILVDDLAAEKQGESIARNRSSKATCWAKLAARRCWWTINSEKESKYSLPFDLNQGWPTCKLITFIQSNRNDEWIETNLSIANSVRDSRVSETLTSASFEFWMVSTSCWRLVFEISCSMYRRNKLKSDFSIRWMPWLNAWLVVIVFDTFRDWSSRIRR